MLLAKSLLFAAVLTVPGAVQAEQIVASDATSVADFFRGEGAKSLITTDDYGDPKIKVKYQGSKFSVYYYGCNDGKNCTSIQFFSGYKTDGSVKHVQVNKWNKDKRYLKAYISDSGNVRIEYDIYLGEYGMEASDFGKSVDLWLRMKAKFEAFIDW